MKKTNSVRNKKKEILISFVGKKDKPKGAILTLLEAKRFDEVNLIWTKSNKEETDYFKIAGYIEEKIYATKLCKKVILHPMQLKNVTDHNEIYIKLLTLCKNQFETRLNDINLTAAISSGTPSMHTCWVLMSELGDFPMILLQIYKPKHSEVPYVEVKAGTGLPKITKLEEEIFGLKPEVTLTINPPSLTIDNQKVILGAIEFCYYRYFLIRAKSREKYMQTRGFELPGEVLECIIEFHNESFPNQDQDILGYRKMKNKEEQITTDRFLPNRSKINKKIRRIFNNPNRSRYCEIESDGMKTAKKYGINLPPEKIKITK
jgi:hypothetical protein